jgi:hypothetical protein
MKIVKRIGTGRIRTLGKHESPNLSDAWILYTGSPHDYARSPEANPLGESIGRYFRVSGTICRHEMRSYGQCHNRF